MKGGVLIVAGNSGFLTGFMMQKGRIIICGDAGEALGDSMYEGTIYVGGSIGSLGADAHARIIKRSSFSEKFATQSRHHTGLHCKRVLV